MFKKPTSKKRIFHISCERRTHFETFVEAETLEQAHAIIEQRLECGDLEEAMDSSHTEVSNWESSKVQQLVPDFASAVRRGMPIVFFGQTVPAPG